MDTLKKIISSLTYGKYIPKDDKAKLAELTKQLVDVKYEKLRTELNVLMSQYKLTKKSLDAITKLTNELKDNSMTIETASELIEETIKEIEDDTLESRLDMECDRYNKFTENNPAEYIYFNQSKDRYILRYDNKELKSKKLHKLVNELLIGLKKEKNFIKIEATKKIEYKGKKIIIYLSDNKAYFDINHVISLFDDIKSKKEKYIEYKGNIVFYDFRDNMYGGFYIKEFINQETFFKMLLHTNSIFSNKFKNDVAKLLDSLTTNGMITITNNNMVAITKKPNEYIIEEYNYTQTYENENLLGLAKERIKECKKLNWNKFLKKHIMYFFLITLEDPDGLNRILCKIGYSCNLIDRFKSLEVEYKCKFYLLGLKLVHSVQDEKEFHTLLKRKYPEFIVNLKIGSHDKDETYVFDKDLYKTFLDYVDKVEFTSNENSIEEESNKIINNYFDNIEERFEMEIIQKFRQIIRIDSITNELQKDVVININKSHYELLLIKEANNYKLSEMKLKNEYELKHREFDHKETMMDKEIDLMRIRLEIAKIKNMESK